MIKYWILLVGFMLLLAACGVSGVAEPEPSAVDDGLAPQPTNDSPPPTMTNGEMVPDVATDDANGQSADENRHPEPGQLVPPVVVPGGSVNLGELTPEAPPAGESEMVEMPAPGVPKPEVKMASLAMQDLGARLSIDISQITVAETEPMAWPDAGLGCPAEGLFYAAVITPGFRITLLADGNTYIYHTDTNQQLVLCVDGQAAPPVDPS